MTKKLSPYTQAVLSAFTEDDGMCRDWKHNHYNLDALSAALRAVAEIVAPLEYEDIWTDGRMLQYEKEDPTREKLLAIADEIESL